MTILGYDFNSGEYSTWTESVWEEPAARIFLKPSWGQEVATLSAGIVVAFISFLITYSVKQRAHILFGQF